MAKHEGTSPAFEEPQNLQEFLNAYSRWAWKCGKLEAERRLSKYHDGLSWTNNDEQYLKEVEVNLETTRKLF